MNKDGWWDVAVTRNVGLSELITRVDPVGLDQPFLTGRLQISGMNYFGKH